MQNFNALMFNNELFYTDKNYLHLDTSKIDLFEKSRVDIPDWKPSINLSPIEAMKTLIFDLETTDKYPQTSEIKMIGVMLSNKKYIIFDWTQYSESEMIQKFYYLLSTIDFDIFTGHNIFNFDIPFLITRSQILGIKHPFKVGNQKVFTTAIQFSKPTTFTQVYLKGINNKSISIIDTYLQILSKDSTQRKLSSYSLKRAVEDYGLRDKNARVELTHTELKEQYAINNTAYISEYLLDDLYDTLLLFNFIFPEIYYQKLFLPDWSFQSISTSGTGSKWNSILETHYKNWPYEIETSPKLDFEGGYTEAKPGIFKGVEKLDVSSLYPSIMLRYGIFSRKDIGCHQLAVLKYITNERLKLKKSKDKNDQALQAVLKIFINSSYGLLGNEFLSFNDMRGAALVTGIGRLIVNRMKSKILECGGKIAEVDTDGILYELQGHNGELIYKEVSEDLPEGINIDREFLGVSTHHADLLYVPPNTKKNKTDDVQGLKKNYLIISGDNYIAKGKFVKRNICKLEKEFPIKFLSLYSSKGLQSALDYYNDILNIIKSGKLPVDDIIINRKASKAEKDVFEKGLVDDNGYCKYYMIPHLKIMKTKTKWEDIKGNRGQYSIDYYLKMVTDIYDEMKKYL